jgi:hypothetical protein
LNELVKNTALPQTPLCSLTPRLTTAFKTWLSLTLPVAEGLLEGRRVQLGLLVGPLDNKMDVLLQLRKWKATLKTLVVAALDRALLW